MASDLNKVILIGRLTRDPELNYLQSGTAIAKFSVANNRTYSVSGEKKEQVSFFNCIAWGKLGELITEYCKKGHRIGLEGRLQQRSWDDPEGNKRSTIEIVVDNFQFLTPKSGGASNSDAGYSGPEPSHDFPEPSQVDNSPFSDDDIPF